MIELDKTAECYVKDFDHLKDPPTHAQQIAASWAIPPQGLDLRSMGMSAVCRRHVQAVYVYGRVGTNGEFIQSASDLKLQPIHAGVDMTEYDLVETPADSEAKKALRQTWKRTMTIRENLLTGCEAPHPEDPAQRLPAPAKRKNRFNETDLDVVFSHTDVHLLGRAV